MITIKIVSHWNSAAVLYEHTTTAERQAFGMAMRDALEAACKSGAYLRGAYLSGADLSGAYLRGAYLGGAKIRDGLVLIGTRPTLVIDAIGSRQSSLTLYLTDKGPRVTTGCFFGTLEEFSTAVAETHADAPAHLAEYTAAIALMRVHAEHWTPAEVTQEAA